MISFAFQTCLEKSYKAIVESPAFHSAHDKAQHILDNMAVTEKQRQEIERQTVGQRNNASWYEYLL